VKDIAPALLVDRKYQHTPSFRIIGQR